MNNSGSGSGLFGNERPSYASWDSLQLQTTSYKSRSSVPVVNPSPERKMLTTPASSERHGGGSGSGVVYKELEKQMQTVDDQLTELTNLQSKCVREQIATLNRELQDVQLVLKSAGIADLRASFEKERQVQNDRMHEFLEGTFGKHKEEHDKRFASMEGALQSMHGRHDDHDRRTNELDTKHSKERQDQTDMLMNMMREADGRHGSHDKRHSDLQNALQDSHGQLEQLINELIGGQAKQVKDSHGQLHDSLHGKMEDQLGRHKSDMDRKFDALNNILREAEGRHGNHDSRHNELQNALRDSHGQLERMIHDMLGAHAEQTKDSHGQLHDSLHGKMEDQLGRQKSDTDRKFDALNSMLRELDGRHGTNDKRHNDLQNALRDSHGQLEQLINETINGHAKQVKDSHGQLHDALHGKMEDQLGRHKSDMDRKFDALQNLLREADGRHGGHDARHNELQNALRDSHGQLERTINELIGNHAKQVKDAHGQLHDVINGKVEDHLGRHKSDMDRQLEGLQNLLRDTDRRHGMHDTKINEVCDRLREVDERHQNGIAGHVQSTGEQLRDIHDQLKGVDRIIQGVRGVLGDAPAGPRPSNPLARVSTSPAGQRTGGSSWLQ